MDTKGKLAETGARAAKSYYESSAIRAAVTAIPYVGGPIDQILAVRGEKITRKRIEGLLSELKNASEKLDETKIDYGFFETDEFFDIFMTVLDAAVRTRECEKIRIYSQILAHTAINGIRTSHNPEQYLFMGHDNFRG